MRITSDPRLIHSFLSTMPSSESFCVSIPDCRSFSSHFFSPLLLSISALHKRWTPAVAIVVATECNCTGEGGRQCEGRSGDETKSRRRCLQVYVTELLLLQSGTFRWWHTQTQTHTHTQSVSQWTCRNSKSKDGSPCPPCTHSALKFDRIFLCLCFGKCLCA